MKKKLQSIVVALAAGMLFGFSARAQLVPDAWYKADAASTVFSNAGSTVATNNVTVQQWNEAQGKSFSLLQATAGARPVFSNVTTLANFNPTVTFDGSNDWMQFTAGSGVNMIGREDGAIVVAGKVNTLKRSGFAGFHASMDYPGLHFFSNNKLLFFTGGPGYQGVSSNVITGNTFFTAGSSWVNGGGTNVNYAGATVLLNGTRAIYSASQLNNAVVNANSRDFRIGADSNYGSFSGQLNEVLVFDAKLTPEELDQVESYLAIKYGTTLAAGAKDYKNWAGATVWSATTNNGFNNNIAGIAHSNANALHQKQSWSTNPGKQVLISTLGLAESNAENGTGLTDGQYLIWGDNGLDKSPTVAFTESGLSNRFASVWKVQNTSGVTTVRVAWPRGLKSLSLIQSSSSTFASGNTITNMTGNTYTIDGVDYNYADVTLSNGQYFTFGAKIPAPGGVSAGLTQWYRADENLVSVGGNGTNITTWTDYARGTVSSKIGTNPVPVYKEGATNYFNFNPGVNFTAYQQMLGNISTQTLENTSFDIFTLTKEKMTNWRFFNVGRNNTSMNGTNWDSPALYASGNVGTRNSAGGGTGIANPGNVAFATTIPSIMYHTFTNTSIRKGLNGAALGTAWNVSARGLSTGGHIFGSNQGANPPGGDDLGFIGHIGEVIVYGGGNLSATDRNKVDSYLALKYGLTLPGNYLDSDGNIVWNSTTNSAYHKNVAGIVRDESSALNQKQSISVNPGQQVVIATTGFNDTNAGNSTPLTDGQYLIWGDNGLSKTLSVSITGIASLNLRFGAIWKVQNTGNVGNVRVTWPAGVPGLTLIQSSDAVIDASDTKRTLMTSSTQTVNGVPYNYADVTLEDGEYFTFAGYVIGPGGVASAAWYRADAAGQQFSDAGTTVATDGAQIQQWNEYKGTGYDLVQATTASKPVFSNEKTLKNFNPTVSFDGSNDRMNYNPASAQAIIDRTKGALFAAGTSLNAGGAMLGFGSPTGANAMDDPGLYSYQGKLLFYPQITHFDVQSTNNISKNFIGGATWENNAGTGTTNNMNSTLMTLDGYHEVKDNGIRNVINTGNTSRGFVIGDDGVLSFKGQLNELVVFEQKLSDIEVSRVESYLAIKYGHTLSKAQNRNYVNAAGNTVWDGTVNENYYHNVAGIARDDEGSLSQKQSSSINSKREVLISTTGLENTNAANTGLLNNGQFLIWGDNNLAKAPSVAISGISGVNYRFASIWKVQNTNSVGTVRVAWPKGYANLKLIQSDDDNITSGDDITDMSGTQVVNGVEYSYADVTLENGKYFTFAAFLQAPGGVTAGILMWHRADDGVVEGGQKDEWQDVSGNNRDVTQPNDDTYRPSLVTSSTYNANSRDYFANYNPFYYFDGTNDFFYNTDISYFPSTNSPGSVYGVMHNSNSGGWRTPYGWGDDDPNLNRSGDSYSIWKDNGQAVSANVGANTLPAHIGGMAWKGAANGIYLNVNGRIYSSTTENIGAIQSPVANQNFAIGSEGVSLTGNGNEPYQGAIPEVFAYSNDHQSSTGDEKVRINSYLAIKYGITLSNDGGTAASDYLSSTSQKVWDATANVGFNSNIAGVANDFRSALHQKQSRSVNTNTNGQVIIGLGEIAETNAANTNTLTDGQFLLWGDNGIKQQMTNVATTYTSFTYAGDPANGRRMKRIWKVQNTNNVGNEVQIRVPKLTVSGVGQPAFAANDACADYVIIFANDSTFTTNVTIEALTINGDDYDVLHNFPNGASYFTYGKVIPFNQGAVYLPSATEATDVYTNVCDVGTWKYFRRTSDDSQKLLGASGYTNTELDNLEVTITTEGTSYDDGTVISSLMPRITTVTNGGTSPVSAGKVRVYYDLAEKNATTVSGETLHGWFKYEGLADDVLLDIYSDGLLDPAKTTQLTPNATGVEDGVNYVEFHNITTFSSFVYLSTTRESALPVTLTYFNASKEGNVANLNWATTTELKSKGFEVQRSSDAKNWKALDFVRSQAEGVSSSVLTYKYADATPLSGNNYYRLKAIDLDGTFAYSKIEKLNFAGIARTLVVYPNPVTDGKLTLDLSESGSYSVKVYTVSGIEMSGIKKTGNVLDVKGLTPGIYLLKVDLGNGETLNKTFIVK